jgi:stringent starvation protein B
MSYSRPKPYLIRALYEWMTDNGLTPYVLVNANISGCIVPEEHVKEGKIILNIATRIVHGLALGNEAIEFKARFGGVPRHIYAPMRAVSAIYAKETGEGMNVPEEPEEEGGDGGEEPKPVKPGKPNLKIVK